MHVVFICNEYPPPPVGGIGSVVATLADRYVAAGHEVSIIGLCDEPGFAEDNGVRIYRLAWPRPLKFTMWLSARRALRRELAALHARQPIHVIEWPDYQGWFWRPIPGVTDLVRLHGTHAVLWHVDACPRDRVMETFEIRMLRRVPNWIGCSQWITDVTKQVSRWTPEKNAVIYNPVDVESFLPGEREPGPPIVMYVGGLKRQKGAIHLVHIARQVWKTLPETRFMFAGPPADLDERDIRAETGETSDRLIFTGGLPQHEIADRLRRASLLVAPSFFEAFSIAWIEALASGVPVVGTNLVAGPEIVRDGVDGLLADPRNTEDFAEKIVRLLKDDTLRRKMGEAGRARAVREFAPNVVAEKSLSFYRECIERAPRAATS